MTMAIHKKTLTEEEVKKFSEENKLNAEELEAVNGGYLYCSEHPTDDLHWQVLDKNGAVVKRFASYYDAYYYACGNGYGANEINSNELEKLRTTGWPW